MRKKNYQNVLSIRFCFSCTFFDIIHFYIILNLKKNVRFKNISKNNLLHGYFDVFLNRKISLSQIIYFLILQKSHFAKKLFSYSNDIIPY